MPKSKHGRGKHPHIKKRGKMRQMPAGTEGTRPAADNIAMAAAPANVKPAPPAPFPKKSAATSAALPIHYEFISGDLKRIGVLAGIIFIILIVLYLFLK